MTTVFGVRQGGVLRIAQINKLDRELLSFLLRFGYARPHHVAGWTGASGWTVQERLGRLRAAGYVDSFQVAVDLRNPDGTVVATIASVWECTPKGAALVGQSIVAGTGGETVDLASRRLSRAVADHTLGAVDVAVWYRRSGFEIASEREIRSREMPIEHVRGQRVVASPWSVQIPMQRGVHPPDLGVVDPDGHRWAIEVERACKPVAAYREVITAYRAARLGQVWHVRGRATLMHLQKACGAAGVTFQPMQRGVLVSTDGSVRLQGWWPARAGLTAPKAWADQWPTAAPAAFPTPDPRPDLTAAWKRGAAIDIHAAPTAGLVTD